MRTFRLKIEFTEEAQAETMAEAIQKIKKLYPKAEIKPALSTRTETQNKSLHLFFTQLAEELNEKGFDLQSEVWKIELGWTAYLVKEKLWRPIQKILTGKKSTTKLDRTKEINLIYDNLNRAITERTKGQVDFPDFPSDPISYNQY